MSKPTQDSDLVVVGAGAAGMAVALVAALKGLKVTLLEASEQVGGTTATSAGTLWVPGNPHAAANGDADVRRYLDALIGPDDARGLREAYLSSVAEALGFLEANSAVQFRASGVHPDYLQLPGAAMAGRAISPAEFDGRLLGKTFRRVRPPLSHFMVLGGMMVGKADIAALLGRFRSRAHFVHSTRLIGRYLRDRLTGYPRGTRLVMGNALVARLLFSLIRAGVKVSYGARSESLIVDDGRVTGLRVRQQGKVLEHRAHLGVVLCAGGIGHHAQLRQSLGATALGSHSLSFEGNLGEGIGSACAIGAALLRSEPDFLWQPVSRVPDGAGSHTLYPHLFLDRAKPGLLAVDAAGRRFVNEGASYHHFVEGMRLAHGGQVRAIPAYLVCNAGFVARYGLGAVHPGTTDLSRWVQRGYVSVADTLDALAAQLGIDATGLRASVAQMNDAAAQGHDPLFGKGDTPVSRFNGDASHQPNPCLGPLDHGPYVGLAVWPGEAANSAGLSTNADGAVLDNTGAPIPGLYACGNDMASLWRGTYPGPGATLGPALVFAYRLVQAVLRPQA